MIAELLEMVLADEGYRVLTAANGRQGLQRLAEDPRGENRQRAGVQLGVTRRPQ